MAYRNQTPITFLVRIRSALFMLLYSLMGIIHGLVSVLVGPFLPFERRYNFINLWTRAALWLLRHLNGVKVELRGRENIPEDGRFVVMSNHQSQFETFFLQVLFAPQATILKRELLWVPFFGWALALLRPIKIDRSKAGSALKQIVEQGKERLDNGVPIVIFPEGTRQSPGEMGEFSVGGAMLASKAGVPILPIAHNAGDCWPARSMLRIPGKIIVSVGPTIATEGRKTREINEETGEWIAGEFRRISEEIEFPRNVAKEAW
jgi:1-acyl-sn-glycerol-3-phosphate acyltransferase